MLGFFRKQQPPSKVERSRLATPLPWRSEATLPIPEWGRIEEPADAAAEQLHAFWDTAAFTWLSDLGARLGDAYSIAESGSFMLLGALSERHQQLALEYAEKSRNRVLNVLSGIAVDEGYGKDVIIVFKDQETYYEYTSNYDNDVPAEEELSFSGGMYINRGYGHFVFVADDLTLIEPVIAHELTHSLLSHLPLPLWINEGIAVNTERRLCPRERSRYTVQEVREKFAHFWNADTIQEFWSGKSWRRPDEGNSLSYELATTFIGLASRDNWEQFVAFVNASDWVDAGDAAARGHLGYPVANFAEAVLGSGNWEPDPSRWKDGAERERL